MNNFKNRRPGASSGERILKVHDQKQKREAFQSCLKMHTMSPDGDPEYNDYQVTKIYGNWQKASYYYQIEANFWMRSWEISSGVYYK